MSGTSSQKNISKESNAAIDANSKDIKIGEVRQSVGRFWRKVVDAAAKQRKEQNCYYFVPLECKVYTAKQLPFDDEERQFAIPSNFPKKHRYLPQRVITKLEPKNLGYGSLVKSKDDIKQYKKLKSEAQQYLAQKNKYLLAQKQYEVAKTQMESLMGIKSLQEIEQFRQKEAIIDTQISNANTKCDEYNTAINKNNKLIQEAQQDLQGFEDKLSTQQNNGNTGTTLLVQNIDRQKRYIQECTVYGHELQKNCNLVKQAVECCEKEKKRTKELIDEAVKIRKQYKCKEDLLEAEKNLEDAKKHLEFLKDKKQKLEATIKWCEDEQQDAGQNSTSGGMSGGAIYNIKQDMIFANAENVISKMGEYTPEAKNNIQEEVKKNRLKIIEENLPYLKDQLKEVQALETEAQELVIKREKELEKLKKDYGITGTSTSTPVPIPSVASIPLKPAAKVPSIIVGNYTDSNFTIEENGDTFSLKDGNGEVVAYRTPRESYDKNGLQFFILDNKNQLKIKFKSFPHYYRYKLVNKKRIINNREYNYNYNFSSTNHDQNRNPVGLNLLFKRLSVVGEQTVTRRVIPVMQQHNAVMVSKVGEFSKNQTNLYGYLKNGYWSFTAYEYPDFGIALKIKDGKVVFAYEGELLHGFLPNGIGKLITCDPQKEMIGRWCLGDCNTGLERLGEVVTKFSYVHGVKHETPNNNDSFYSLTNDLSTKSNSTKQMENAKKFAEFLIKNKDKFNFDNVDFLKKKSAESLDFQTYIESDKNYRPYKPEMFLGGAPTPPTINTLTTDSPLLDIAQRMHTIANIKGGLDKNTKQFKMEELSKLHMQAGAYLKNSLNTNSTYQDTQTKLNFLGCAQQALRAGGRHHKILGANIANHLLEQYN